MMRIALAQINPTVGDMRGNAELIIGRAKEAVAAGATVVAFPELAQFGFEGVASAFSAGQSGGEDHAVVSQC